MRRFAYQKQLYHEYDERLCHHHPQVVCRQRARAALARHPRPVCHLAERDHSATDAHPAGTGLLGAVHAALAHRGRPGACHRRRGAARMAGTGLLLEGAQPAQGGSADSRGRTVSADAGGHPPTEGRGRLYGCRHRLVCLRTAGRCGRRQCLPGAGTLFRHRHTHQHHRGEEDLHGAGRPPTTRA